MPVGKVGLVGNRRATCRCDCLLRREVALVVVNDFNLLSMSILPVKAHTILLIDSNAVLTNSIAPQPFKPIARWDCQLLEFSYSIDLVERVGRVSLA